MAIAGIGSEPSVAFLGPVGGADAASPAGVAPAPEAPLAQNPALAGWVQDGFDAAGQSQVGDAKEAVVAARQDLRAARRDLRHARNETGPQGKVDRMVAREEVHAARAELVGARRDLVAARRATPTEAAGLPDSPGAPGIDDPLTAGLPPGLAARSLGANDDHPGRGLALGRERKAISQLRPEGADETYRNGEMNCAPAAMAVVARSIPGGMLDGKPVAAMSDAELIKRLGEHGQTNEEGTSPNGVIAMAEDMGLTTTAARGGFDQAFSDDVLARGGSVIVNGALDFDGQLAGHFMVVTGKTASGSYLVNDPWSGQTQVYTPAQLDAFLLANPVYGGISIGVV